MTLPVAEIRRRTGGRMGSHRRPQTIQQRQIYDLDNSKLRQKLALSLRTMVESARMVQMAVMTPSPIVIIMAGS